MSAWAMETNADAEIQANFPTVFLCNFTHHPTVDTQFGTAGPCEIAWLSDMYTAYGGNLPDLCVAFARQLGAPNDYEAHSVQYQFGNGTGAGGLSFLTAPLPNNYLIAAYASTTIPGAPELDPRAAGSALMLLAGIALVLKGRRRG